MFGYGIAILMFLDGSEEEPDYLDKFVNNICFWLQEKFSSYTQALT